MNRIKTVIILTAVLFTGVLSISCSSDDNKQEATIIGEWKDTSKVTEYFTNDISDRTIIELINDNNFERITLNADNTFSFDYSDSNIINGVEKVYPGTNSGTFTFEKSKLYLLYDAGTPDEETEEYDFKLENNQLTLNFSDEKTINGDVIKSVETTIFNRQ